VDGQKQQVFEPNEKPVITTKVDGRRLDIENRALETHAFHTINSFQMLESMQAFPAEDFRDTIDSLLVRHRSLPQREGAHDFPPTIAALLYFTAISSPRNLGMMHKSWSSLRTLAGGFASCGSRSTLCLIIPLLHAKDYEEFDMRTLSNIRLPSLICDFPSAASGAVPSTPSTDTVLRDRSISLRKMESRRRSLMDTRSTSTVTLTTVTGTRTL